MRLNATIQEKLMSKVKFVGRVLQSRYHNLGIDKNSLVLMVKSTVSVSDFA